MTSGLLTGERRWASARRSGMTVLGKVSVPKPINLPSQRLENHGLDPNVEIVPKGTHNWGSKSSPSTSNAWGSSTFSPNVDGGTVSPSHLSSHLSSGGSGTRPSTAGSDKAHDLIPNAWGSHSRPSSASGTLSSNQTSHTTFRPHSAETRPGSSQLSRFAEHLTDSSVPWSASGTAEKLGVMSSKSNEFSLSSGDFPTLGSEKEPSAPNAESEADTTLTTNVKVGSGHPWRRDNFPSGEEGTKPGVEKWHADNQFYPNANIHQQHYDGWRGGPPVNSHPGGWYRGPPGGPPFAGPVLSGGFPMEPYPYYHPQIPPNALANPQTVPPQGAGPRAPPSKNGDIYRPHSHVNMHESYMRPGMPLRPGFYPAPVPFEGYYGPTMSYHNANERDIPFIGMPMHPASHNRFAIQNATDPGNSNGRSSGYGPTGKEMVSEQVEAGHPRNAHGPHRVLMKHPDGWEGNDGGQKLDDSRIPKSVYHGKGDHPSKSSFENNDRRSGDRKDREMDARRMAQGEEIFSKSVNEKESDHEKSKSSDGTGILRTPEDNKVKKPLCTEHAASNLEASASHKDSGLIQKIESLNARARSSDGRHDVKSDFVKENQKNSLQIGNATCKPSANEVNTVNVSFEQTHVIGIVDTQEGADSGARGMATTRRFTHTIGGTDHLGKGKFSSQDAEGWHKRPNVTDSSSTTSPLQFGSTSVHRQDHTFPEAAEMSRPYYSGRDDEGSMSHNSETTDSQSQRAKMRELAKQRLKQREKEEEERTRDQKAKALAKLEELNRRTQIGEAVTQKLETSAIAATENKQETSFLIEINPSAVAESRAIGVDKPTALSSGGQKVTPKATHVESGAMPDQSRPLQHDIRIVDVANHSNAVLVHDTNASKQKHTGYRQKQNTLLGNKTEEKLTPSTVEALGNATNMAANATVSLEGIANGMALNTEPSLPVSPSFIVESSVYHKKKNRGGKNKHKVESISSTALPLMVSKEPAALDNSLGSGKVETSESVSDPSSVQSLSDSKDANMVLEKHLPTLNEEISSRASSQLKPQHSRRVTRNPHANKSTEKSYNSDAVFWAPVRPQNKAEVGDDTNQKSVVEVASFKSDQQLQNNPKNKRAEIERYVPKPVAKEMAQQGSGHQSVTPAVNNSAADDAVVKGESGNLGAGNFRALTAGMGKEVCSTESRNGDGRQNKSGKGHGSWRQQGSTECGFSSAAGRNVPKTTEHCQPQNPDANSGKGQSSSSDEWNAHDGWNMPEHCDAPAIISVTKDQSVIGKGKRQQQKGHRGLGYNNDPDGKGATRLDFEKVNTPSSPSEMHQTEPFASVKDNLAVNERPTSHWQPKSQVHSTPRQRGSRASNTGSFGSEIGSSSKRSNTASIGALVPTQLDDESTAVKMKSHHDQSQCARNLEEGSNDGHQHEAKRERKAAVGKGHPGSPGEPYSDADLQNDKRASSGFRKNGNQTTRFVKEPESHGHSGGYGKDKKQHIVPTNRERQRHNSHYEYQPVGPHNVNKANSFEAHKDGSYNSVSRFRERSNSRSESMQGGGSFYRRQTDSVQVDASYD